MTGEVYSVGGGRVARVFIGVTPGYVNKALTAEDVAENLGQIRAEEGYEVPQPQRRDDARPQVAELETPGQRSSKPRSQRALWDTARGHTRLTRAQGDLIGLGRGRAGLFFIRCIPETSVAAVAMMA